MDTKSLINQLFEKYKELSVKELVSHLGVSKQMIHRLLKEMVLKGEFEKLGIAPKTLYRKKKISNRKESNVELEGNASESLKENFLMVSDTGQLLDGEVAFGIWCDKRNQPFEKTVHEYIKTVEKYKQYKNTFGLIEGTDKLKNTYHENTYLNKVFYLEFYAIERFGKTRLGTLLHYAKQGQNKFLMNILIREIKENVLKFIVNEGFDAVGYVPPTIRREVQIMKTLEENFNVPLPVVNILKISGIIPVPQKSLNKLEDRIVNAENTFAIAEVRKFNKVLLIDDAVGSGSTLNQIAEKIKRKEVAKEVYGLAVVGSFKGFDVITDI
jgi:hypothetical protein